MMTKLFIDDERFPVTDDWVIVRSSKQAIAWVQTYGIPTHISFDHDLGGDDTSRVFIQWLTDQLIDEKLKFPPNFSFTVHSQNPIGARWIQGTMDGLVKNFG